jgi:hypothetical protein
MDLVVNYIMITIPYYLYIFRVVYPPSWFTKNELHQRSFLLSLDTCCSSESMKARSQTQSYMTS